MTCGSPLRRASATSSPDVSVRPRPVWALAFLAVALAATIAASVATGAVPFTRSDLWAVFVGHEASLDPLTRTILFDIRLPRVLFAALAGAALAVAGAVMQALFRNPLAEPGLIGVTAGGALGAVSAIVLTAGGFWLMAPAAFIGSLAATALAYALGRRVPGAAGLLLAGVALNTIAASLIGVLTTMASDAQLRDLTFWSLGSLADIRWSVVTLLGPLLMLCMVWLIRRWRTFNALLLGEREALHLGWSVERLRRQTIFAVALMVGPLVAATGGIAFVGLVVPHIMRLLLGADHRCLLPASLLGGAVALTAADTLARVAVAPAELPIGLVTSHV
ncbi:MAG: iron ABC transporter permease, partial [Burkholderiaceae bacterium]|nr:iron ABC transporter permease [Burkholderiaceae bacterium]